MVEINHGKITKNDVARGYGDDLLLMFNCLLNIKNDLVISGYADHYSEQTISALLDRIESDLIAQGSSKTNEAVSRA